MLLRFRLDKTARSGSTVRGRVCNLDCTWCHHDYFDHGEFTAISNGQFVEITKRIIEVTGASEAIIKIAGDGEPTTVGTQELAELVKHLKTIPQVSQVKLTTNGVLLGRMSATLSTAGLDQVTVSLNSLSRQGYRRYARRDLLDTVLQSINAAYEAGLNLKINTIYGQHNANEIEAFEDLSVKYDGMPIKLFDLLVIDSETKTNYRSLAYLEEELVSRGASYHEVHAPYAMRVYRLPSGACFVVKISGHYNDCPNLNCPVREYCLEGCRNSIRIGLDGTMRPCGIRSDNCLPLTSSSISPEAIIKALRSGGKIPAHCLQ